MMVAGYKLTSSGSETYLLYSIPLCRAVGGGGVGGIILFLSVTSVV